MAVCSPTKASSKGKRLERGARTGKKEESATKLLLPPGGRSDAPENGGASTISPAETSTDSKFPAGMPSQEGGFKSRAEGRKSYTSTLRANLVNTVRLRSDMVRGINLRHVLANFGALFAVGGTAASQDTYLLSEAVDQIDFFLSHSWSTPRYVKYLAVLQEFNVWPACFATLIVQTLIFTYELLYFESLPPFILATAKSHVDYTDIHTTGLCTIGSIVTFLLVALYGHKLSTPRHIFLDIACISQNNQQLKASGIASLGAMLDRSEQMLIMMDERYWSRLWCAFEIAAFAKRAGMDRMRVVPIHVPIFEAGGLAWIVVISLLNVIVMYFTHHFIDEESGVLVVTTVEVVLLIPTTAVLLRAMSASHRSLAALQRLRSFRLEECQCFDARDRKALLAIIGEWWCDDSSHELSTEERHATGWHRFEMYVRQDLRQHIMRQTGGRLISPRALASMALINNAQYLDMFASEGTDVYAAFMLIAVMVGTIAFSFPIIFRAIDAIAMVLPPLQRLCGAQSAADFKARGPSAAQSVAAYALLVPVATLVILGIFSVPFLPLAWAHSRHFTGEAAYAEFWSHGFEMSTDFRAPPDGLTETQRRVFKLQLYLLTLFLGISAATPGPGI